MLLETTALALGLAVFPVLVALPIELRTGEIPNWLTIGSLLIGLALPVFDGHFQLHWLAFFAGAVPALVLYQRGLIGGGAVKLSVAASTLGGTLLALTIGLVIGTLYLFSFLRRSSKESPSTPWISIGVALACAIAILAGWVSRY